MAAINTVSQSSSPNRRRRVRHKIQTPAYASFARETKGYVLDLHEVVDISEDGIAIQCHSPLEPEKSIELCLDLADCPQQIFTTGHVVWSDSNGRSGVRFAELPPASLSRLREWLFVNVMAGVANSEVDLSVPFDARTHSAPQPNYTDKLEAVKAVRHQVEALGTDVSAALQLIVERTRSLMQASGAAIALAGDDPNVMNCRASSGPDAPPVGAHLQVGSGFSGECVKRGTLLRCDDTETDTRVDRERCRSLGLRSILAAPIRVADKSIGLIEVLSNQPNAFTDSDGRVILSLADLILQAVNRESRDQTPPPLGPTPEENKFSSPQGSILFAAADEKKDPEPDEKHAAAVSLPRSHLFLLTCAFAAVSLALGFVSAPWIQTDVAPWVMRKLHMRSPTPPVQTVLASSKAPAVESASIETATFDQLRQMAESGNPSAQNALGLCYATGDGVALNEQQAVLWFTKAAEQGNVAAQSKLGSIYYSGRGVPQDANRAYFWMVVARLGGDDASKTLAPFVRARLTRAQVASIEQDASRWLQQHSSKPQPGQMKSSL